MFKPSVGYVLMAGVLSFAFINQPLPNLSMPTFLDNI